MKKSKTPLRILIVIMVLMMLLPVNAFADSSWVWISEKRPFDILPWVALGTILIEWLCICFIPKTGHAFKVLGIVMVANAASFLLPYAFLKADLSWYGTFEHILDSGPHYIVSGVFLLITLLVEMPIVYNVLKSKVQDKRVLQLTIIVSNGKINNGRPLVTENKKGRTND